MNLLKAKLLNLLLNISHILYNIILIKMLNKFKTKLIKTYKKITIKPRCYFY